MAAYSFIPTFDLGLFRIMGVLRFPPSHLGPSEARVSWGAGNRIAGIGCAAGGSKAGREIVQAALLKGPAKITATDGPSWVPEKKNHMSCRRPPHPGKTPHQLPPYIPGVQFTPNPITARVSGRVTLQPGGGVGDGGPHPQVNPADQVVRVRQGNGACVCVCAEPSLTCKSGPNNQTPETAGAIHYYISVELMRTPTHTNTHTHQHTHSLAATSK